MRLTLRDDKPPCPVLGSLVLREGMGIAVLGQGGGVLGPGPGLGPLNGCP